VTFDELTVADLQRAYRTGDRRPVDVVEATLDAIEHSDTNAWIATRDRPALREDAAALDAADPDEYPLYGVPFAVKDNIDYAGLPTTAGCPSYASDPEESAHVVDRLVDAGALLVGKTNMDQFATGLVGTRSPYGACRNPFDDASIAGGSSAGSAVAVARGQVAFALGTDTAGSGRVPAAFNRLVGLKPTRGAVSTRGVVPACRTLDCVSVFANTVEDARAVGEVAVGYDAADPYSRPAADDLDLSPPERPTVTVGVPDEGNLAFFGDDEAAELFEAFREDLADGPWTVETVDFAPFVETASLLYGGPWVAERYAAVGEFLATDPDDVDPVVERIIEGGADYSAVDTFEAMYELQARKREVAAVFDGVDVLVTPTTGTIYTVDEVRADPVELNSNLGYYTNFANLLDLSAVAVPVDTFEAGPGFGVTVFGEAFEDGLVAAVAERLVGGERA
jgi:allophanate hydrolase